MITAAHFLLYSSDADADRVYITDVLQFTHVDAGHGWLIFRLPPSELAVHPANAPFVHTEGPQSFAGAVLYLMCDELDATMKELAPRGVTFGSIGDAQWGRFTSFPLPSGMHVGLYQPKHKIAALV